MKVLFAFSILFIFLFSCKKDSPSVSSQTITGTLKYTDPAVDGPGLYFETDSREPLLFKNEFSDYYTQYQHYKEWVDVHARLIFVEVGNGLFIGNGSLPATASNAFDKSCEIGKRISLPRPASCVTRFLKNKFVNLQVQFNSGVPGFDSVDL